MGPKVPRHSERSEQSRKRLQFCSVRRPQREANRDTVEHPLRTAASTTSVEEAELGDQAARHTPQALDRLFPYS